MNYPLIVKIICTVLKVEFLAMLIPAGISFVFGGEDLLPFLITMALICSAIVPMSRVKPTNTKFKIIDGFAVVSLTWIMAGLFGSIPYYLSGCFESYVDCLFESISGFTTTGATILKDVENLPKGILFWRGLTHWMGGMGVLVFILAIIPTLGASAVNLLRAESTGPTPSKFVPKIKETAKILYLIYFFGTVLEAILLKLAGLSVYDAVFHALSSAGTGGFSTLNSSVGGFNNVFVEIIIAIFNCLFGVNFVIYYFILKGNLKGAMKDEEVRVYFSIILIALVMIAVNVTQVYGSFFEAFRRSMFQVTSIISSAGFASADTNMWPALSQCLIVFLSFVGCCAGSTGGGLKIIRLVILVKTAIIDLKKVMSPSVVKIVRINGKRVSQEVISQTASYFFLYIALFFVACLLIALEGKDLLTVSTSVIACLSNIGPGLGLAGSLGNYADFSWVSKLVYIFCMLAGRLEFYPVLILFAPRIWRIKNQV